MGLTDEEENEVREVLAERRAGVLAPGQQAAVTEVAVDVAANVAGAVAAAEVEHVEQVVEQAQDAAADATLAAGIAVEAMQDAAQAEQAAEAVAEVAEEAAEVAVVAAVDVVGDAGTASDELLAAAPVEPVPVEVVEDEAPQAKADHWFTRPVGRRNKGVDA